MPYDCPEQGERKAARDWAFRQAAQWGSLRFQSSTRRRMAYCDRGLLEEVTSRDAL